MEWLLWIEATQLTNAVPEMQSVWLETCVLTPCLVIGSCAATWFTRAVYLAHELSPKQRPQAVRNLRPLLPSVWDFDLSPSGLPCLRIPVENLTPS
jgi:hypothetical protein